MKVFLSHNSSDKEFVRRVAIGLREERLRPWLDIWELAAGDLLRPTLEKAIRASKCFILFWSNASQTAEWVEWERRNAAALKDTRRICVRLDDIIPPPELSQRVWLDWLDWEDEASFQEKLRILVLAIHGKPPEEPPKIKKVTTALISPHIEPTHQLLNQMYLSLKEHCKVVNWWKRENKFQICVEAILTQGTGWNNVEVAIENLNNAKALTPGAIYEMTVDQLQDLIRPCGRVRSKASYIKNFVRFLEKEYQLSFEEMLLEETGHLRQKLLRIKGIGNFTCDNMLLYAIDRPKLPINDRMRKVFYEHDLIDEIDTYDTVQDRIERATKFNSKEMRELDELLFQVARKFCHSEPKCHGCPLQHYLPEAGPRTQRINL